MSSANCLRNWHQGKTTRLFAEDLPVAKALEVVGLLFLIGQDEPYAVITPKGRHVLAELASRGCSNRPAASWNNHASGLNTASSHFTGEGYV